MKCEHCGEKVIPYSEYLEIVEKIEEISKSIQELKKEVKLGTTSMNQMMVLASLGQDKQSDIIIEKLDLQFRTLTVLNEYAQETLGTTKDINETTHRDLEETSKVLLWLELKGARNEDLKSEDIGLFDPLVLELLKKYSGLEWQELAREIKNKGIKQLLNKMKQEDEDNRKGM